MTLANPVGGARGVRAGRVSNLSLTFRKQKVRTCITALKGKLRCKLSGLGSRKHVRIHAAVQYQTAPSFTDDISMTRNASAKPDEGLPTTESRIADERLRCAALAVGAACDLSASNRSTRAKVEISTVKALTAHFSPAVHWARLKLQPLHVIFSQSPSAAFGRQRTCEELNV